MASPFQSHKIGTYEAGFFEIRVTKLLTYFLKNKKKFRFYLKAAVKFYKIAYES
jgi:hypothetical protein